MPVSGGNGARRTQYGVELHFFFAQEWELSRRDVVVLGVIK